MADQRRALHYVFKIGNREATMDFYTRVLGMMVIRHEEFSGGCAATCNGPYDLAWSKTMVGYGDEDNNFVVELTYNYGISSYKNGNDFQGLTIQSANVTNLVKASGYPFAENAGHLILKSPCGYIFNVEGKPDEGLPQITEYIISASNLKTSEIFWKELLSMNVYDSSKEGEIKLGYADNQAKLILKQIEGPVDRGSAYGRIAFSCPSAQQKEIQKLIEDNGQTVLTPFISLETPGKATVQVVILADPDGHEICFVGDEGFRQLSQIDPLGPDLLKEAIKNDKSNDWFKAKGIEKKEV